MVARTAAKKAGNEFRRSRAASRASIAPRRNRRRLARFPRGENHLVASLVSLRSERVVPPASRRMNLLMRYTRLIARDRKSTRLNSSHQIISYAVFCLKKKKKKETYTR